MSEKKYHHGDLKNAMIREGINIFLSEGEKNLSLRKVASNCGVSPAAPYSHFKNKEELLEEIQNHISNEVMKAIASSYEKSTQKGKPLSIYHIGRAYVEFFIEHPNYYDFIFKQPCVNIDLTIDGISSFKPFQFYKEKCYEVYRNVGLSDEEIQIGIINMWALVHGLASIATMKYVRRDFKWEEKLEKIILG